MKRLFLFILVLTCVSYGQFPKFIKIPFFPTYPVLEYGDHIPPVAAENFIATSVDTTAIKIQASGFAEFDTVIIRFKTVSYPASITDGTLLLATNDSTSINNDNINANLADKTTYYVRMFLGDAIPNWIHNSDTCRTKDYTPPTLASVTIDTLGTDSVEVTLSGFSADVDSTSMTIYTAYQASPVRNGGSPDKNNTDSLNTWHFAHGVTDQDTLYLYTWVADSNANWCTVKRDTLYIPDMWPPDGFSTAIDITQVYPNVLKLTWLPAEIAAADVDSMKLIYAVTNGTASSYNFTSGRTESWTIASADSVDTLAFNLNFGGDTTKTDTSSNFAIYAILKDEVGNVDTSGNASAVLTIRNQPVTTALFDTIKYIEVGDTIRYQYFVGTTFVANDVYDSNFYNVNVDMPGWKVFDNTLEHECNYDFWYTNAGAALFDGDTLIQYPCGTYPFNGDTLIAYAYYDFERDNGTSPFSGTLTNTFQRSQASPVCVVDMDAPLAGTLDMNIFVPDYDDSTYVTNSVSENMEYFELYAGTRDAASKEIFSANLLTTDVPQDTLLNLSGMVSYVGNDTLFLTGYWWDAYENQSDAAYDTIFPTSTKYLVSFTIDTSHAAIDSLIFGIGSVSDPDQMNWDMRIGINDTLAGSFGDTMKVDIPDTLITQFEIAYVRSLIRFTSGLSEDTSDAVQYPGIFTGGTITFYGRTKN